MRRGRSEYRYKYDTQINLRIGQYEKAMLDCMKRYWGTSMSETVRRCIVYTFAKFIVKREGLTLNDIIQARDIAMQGLARRGSERET